MEHPKWLMADKEKSTIENESESAMHSLDPTYNNLLFIIY